LKLIRNIGIVLLIAAAAALAYQYSRTWATLVVAGLLEVLWASGLKSVSLQRPLTSLGVLIALAASMILLWVATQRLPIGTAYAVWTGIGAVGAALVGIVVYGEPATAVRAVCILLIVAGIVGLKLFSGAHA
jgi:quaternary ammonium compound-resistance protein SugE